MADRDKDELLDHNYDGIQEYDNDLPGWWVYLFWVTIIIAVVYPFIYDFGSGKFAVEIVDEQVAELKALQAASMPKSMGEPEAAKLLALAKDSGALKLGSEIFATRCAACHSAQGQGLIGPNLTDDNWIHGGKITNIHRTVSDGVLDKGMLAWKDQLKPEELNAVVAFVWSIHGTNPPNPKAPDGAFEPRG